MNSSKTNQLKDDWVERLTDAGVRQDQALTELGDLLKTRVTHAFRTQPKCDSAFVDDVVQDALTSILDSILQFKGESKFLTWATTLAVRTAIRQMRRQRWKDTSLDQLRGENPSSIDIADEGRHDPAAKASSNQLIETMYQIINEKLADKQRQVLLAHLNGMPQAEIGRRLGTNRNAVYKLGFDARKRLKEELAKAGYSAEDLENFEATR